jgi:aspartate/methionine/tyrosine aminotransferase
MSKNGEKVFTSALEAAGPTLGPFVHWVYALSKDFGLSGMRVGVVYTENEPVLMALQKLNDLCQVSSQTQLWTKRLLEYTVPGGNTGGERWTQYFRRENHTRLRSRSIQITNLLDQYQIPYLPPTAGLFVWLDLSKFLTNVSPLAHDSERALYMKLILTYGLLLTPGSSNSPWLWSGWRICCEPKRNYCRRHRRDHHRRRLHRRRTVALLPSSGTMCKQVRAPCNCTTWLVCGDNTRRWRQGRRMN